MDTNIFAKMKDNYIFSIEWIPMFAKHEREWIP